jgi:VWFA-related protein
MRHTLTRVIGAVLLATLGAALVLAQSPAPANPPGSGQQPIRVGTSLVRVDVYPTKDGQVVAGLERADFEVLEDGVVQRIESFDHVVAIRGPQAARTEPGSQRDMLQAVANPRSRVFLVFLDGAFVDDESARAINAPLIKFLTNELGDDDLVGVLTPAMRADQITFGRKTEVLAGSLPTAFMSWGRQDRELDPELDRREIQYSLCYPGINDVPGKMAARRRERVTLDALQDAVRHLGAIRQERKAIIAVTQGWVLYREDPSLMNKRSTEAPLGVDKVHVGPDGRLTLEDKRNTVNAMSPTACDQDRLYLAGIDNDRFLREIIDDANRANSTFYMIDPGGLKLKGADRSQAMRTLAEGTDGFAVLNTNNLDQGWSRIGADMSSYYLLGYYASNTKPDGRFRSITVRVKKPGVTVRARKGYRAPSAEELTAMRATTATAPVVPTAVAKAIDKLNGIRADQRFRVHAVAASSAAGRGTVWVAGELQASSGRPDEFAQGATADIDVSAGGASVTARATLKPGERTFLTALALPAGATGELNVRARVAAADGGAIPLADTVRVAAGPSALESLLFRRGLTTGNRLLPTADFRFSRTERARIEIPVGADAKPGTGRVLDRAGQQLQVPVTTGERLDEASGQRWITADVALAPLSLGDYAVEIRLTGAASAVVMAPIRVTR